jgi:hypothetical protein
MLYVVVKGKVIPLLNYMIKHSAVKAYGGIGGKLYHSNLGIIWS